MGVPDVEVIGSCGIAAATSTDLVVTAVEADSVVGCTCDDCIDMSGKLSSLEVNTGTGEYN